MCESVDTRSPKTTVGKLTESGIKATRLAVLQPQIDHDREHNLRGEHAVTSWLKQLADEHRVPATTEWSGFLPDVLVTYLSKVHGATISKRVHVSPSGRVTELYSEKGQAHKHGRVLREGWKAPAADPELPWAREGGVD